MCIVFLKDVAKYLFRNPTLNIWKRCLVFQKKPIRKSIINSSKFLSKSSNSIRILIRYLWNPVEESVKIQVIHESRIKNFLRIVFKFLKKNLSIFTAILNIRLKINSTLKQLALVCSDFNLVKQSTVQI